MTYKINRCDHRRPTTISNNSKVIALFSFYLLIRFVFCPRHVYFRPLWIWYIECSSSIKLIILMFSCTMYTYMIDLFILPVPYYYISVEHNYWLAINNQILKLQIFRIVEYTYMLATYPHSWVCYFVNFALIKCESRLAFKFCVTQV